MTLYDLKPRFQATLRPLAGRLARAGATANQVTVAAAAGSVALGALLYAWGADRPALYILLPIWLGIRMALNAIDGMLAREHGQASTLGAYLNELGDVVSDAALLLPLATIAPFSAPWVVLVVLLAALSEMAGVIPARAGAPRHYDGPLGKSDRAMAAGALGLWIALAQPLPVLAWWIMPLLAAALVWTIANRVRRGIADARATSPEKRP